MTDLNAEIYELKKELRRSQRRQFAFVIATLVLFTCLNQSWFKRSTAYAKEDVIEAKKIVLNAGEGSQKIILEATKQDASLQLLDSEGNIRLKICSSGKQGTKLQINDENEKTRACLGVINKIPALYLYDQNGKLRLANFSLDKNGESGIQIFDSTGRILKDY